MMVQIPDVLSAEEAGKVRALLDKAAWRDGRETAGHIAVRAKSNLQLRDDDPLARQLGDEILTRLSSTPRFLAAALPLRVMPPRFNRYEDSGAYGDHIDNAIFTPPGTPVRIRGDLSATLFLSEPDRYDGGELVIQTPFGPASVKLPAGHMVLYPSGTLHHVTPVTRGARLASFFWVQSMVREESRRAMLLELDDTIQAITAETPDHASLASLTGLYHNLLREWAIT